MDSKRWVFICVWINVCFDSWETYCKKERILGNKHSLILTHYNNIDINFPTQSKAFKIAPWNCKQGPAEPCSNLLRYSRWLKAWVCHQDCCNAFLHQTSLQLAMITDNQCQCKPQRKYRHWVLWILCIHLGINTFAGYTGARGTKKSKAFGKLSLWISIDKTVSNSYAVLSLSQLNQATPEKITALPKFWDKCYFR